jgi:hypothetical protein
MGEQEQKDLLAEVRAYIQRHVIAGFDPPSSIVESVVEAFSEEADEDTLWPLVERLTRETVEAHFRDQASWPELTDCDRLDDAFEELNRHGIVCRQNFTCCGTCGVAEIGGEIRAEEEHGLAVRGYAFYHMQDTESAAEGYGLYLNYGSVEGDRAATLQVGKEIVEALERHELTTEWNGRIETRIHVPLDWKRRRPLEINV